MVPLADTRGWEPLFLGGLILVDGLLLAVWCARGSDLWKLEATALVVGG